MIVLIILKYLYLRNSLENIFKYFFLLEQYLIINCFVSYFLKNL